MSAQPPGWPHRPAALTAKNRVRVMKEPYTKSGKCGNIVWQRNRYGQISYPWFIPKTPRTIAQLQVRASFGSVSARWRTLAEAQRLSWCVAGRTKQTRRRLGRCGPLPGFNYFVKVNVMLVHRGQPQVDLPPGDSPPPETSFASLAPPLLNPAPQLPADSPPTKPEAPGPAPPPSG